MKFSTVAAVSAAVFGGVALANPGSVIYETKIVTITSCGPSVSSCPGKTQTSYIPVTSSSSVHLTTTGKATTPCPTGTGAVPTGTAAPPKPAPVCPGSPHCPPSGPGGPGGPGKSVPTKPTYPIIPTGTGVPQPPKNTSVPVVPSVPAPKPTAPVSTGAGAKMGVSILAVAGAAAFAFLA